MSGEKGEPSGFALRSSDAKVAGTLLVLLLITSAPFMVFTANATVSPSSDCGSGGGCGGSVGSGGCESGSGGCGGSGGNCCGDSGGSGCGSGGCGGNGGCGDFGGGCGTGGEAGCGSGSGGCDVEFGSSGGCKPGSNSGCSSAATGCGPPSSEGSSSGRLNDMSGYGVEVLSVTQSPTLINMFGENSNEVKSTISTQAITQESCTCGGKNCNVETCSPEPQPQGCGGAAFNCKTFYCGANNCNCGPLCDKGAEYCERIDYCFSSYLGGCGYSDCKCGSFCSRPGMPCGGLKNCKLLETCKGTDCPCGEVCPKYQPCAGAVTCKGCSLADCKCGLSCLDSSPTWPCYEASIEDWCDCPKASNDCNCGYELDCIEGVDDFMPCKEKTVQDKCDCGVSGGSDCECGFEVDCINGEDDYMPCGGASSCVCGGTACTCSDYCSSPACGGVPCEEVPEFPLGFAMQIALIPVIIYVWWKSRHKPKSDEKRIKVLFQSAINHCGKMYRM